MSNCFDKDTSLEDFCRITTSGKISKKRNDHPEPTPPRPKLEFRNNMGLGDFLKVVCGGSTSNVQGRPNRKLDLIFCIQYNKTFI